MSTEKLVAKSSTLNFLLRHLVSGLSIEQAREKLASHNKDDKARLEQRGILLEECRKTRSREAGEALDAFDKQYELARCECSKKTCEKCFLREVVMHLATVTGELGLAEKRADGYLDLIYTHYWYVDAKDLRIKKVGDWKPDPNLWPQAAKENK